MGVEVLSRITRYFFLSNYHFVGEGVVCEMEIFLRIARLFINLPW